MRRLGLAVCVAAAFAPVWAQGTPTLKPGLWERTTEVKVSGLSSSEMAALPKAVHLGIPLLVSRNILVPQITTVTLHLCVSATTIAEHAGDDQRVEAIRSMMPCKTPEETRPGGGVSELCTLGDGYIVTHVYQARPAAVDGFSVKEEIEVAREVPSGRSPVFNLNIHSRTRYLGSDCGGCRPDDECASVITPPGDFIQ